MDAEILTARLANLSPTKRALLNQRLGSSRVSSSDTQSIPRRDIREPTPLSFAQERLWFLSQMDPESSAYNEAAAVQLDGALNLDALKSALDALVVRHEALRTNFIVTGGDNAAQVIRDPQPVELNILNISAFPQNERNDAVQHLVTELKSRLFDLAQGLMLRTTLLRLRSDKHILVIVTHHIATDAWSNAILLHEFALLYAAFSKNEPNPLPQLPIQYADYAIWQRNWLEGEVLKHQVSYWKEQLSNLTVLQLPTDRPRPTVQSYRGARKSMLFSKHLSDQLHEFSRKERVTLFMTLLAVFKVLLYRYTGQDDIALGSPIAGRACSETERLVGFFVNTLVLRTDLSGNPTFQELLNRIREMALAAYEHQDLPFEKLVEQLRPNRDLGRTPFFQVMFAHQTTRRPLLELPDLQLSWVEINNETAKFDLSIDTSETVEGITATFEYSTDLFDELTITRMMGHFQTLLESIVANPNQVLDELPILSEADKRQLLVEWNNTEKDFPKNKCVHELFEAWVEKTPDAIAVVFDNQRTSYRVLNGRANQLAHYLKKLGVGPESLVAICVPRSVDMLVGLLAVLKAGGAYVPLDPENPRSRLEFLLRETEAPLLLTRERVPFEVWEYRGRIISLDRDWQEIGRESDENLPNEGSPNNLAYVIYTSGSTGRPKGTLISHSNLLNAYFAWEDAYQLGPKAPVYLQMANFAFDVFAADWLRALCSGGKLVLCPAELLLDAAQLYALMRREGVDCADFVPMVMRHLINYLEHSGQTLDFMRLVVVGSEVWYVADYKRIRRLCGQNTRLMNSYGLSEATIDSSYFSGDVTTFSDRASMPIGRPFPNTQIYIVDRHLQPVPIGVPGELCVSGAGLSRGYLNRAELTAEKFIANPFSVEPRGRLYRTGDRARWLSDGNVEFLGRLDDQIKIRGFRIELGEIESILYDHPAVRQAIVLVHEVKEKNKNGLDTLNCHAQDQESDRRLVAYLVPKQSPAPTTGELRGFLSARLPDYMVPSAIVFLNALPLTPNGKVDRQSLPLPEMTMLELNENFVAPRTPDEQKLAGIWGDLLKIARISIYDNFFDLGGHSLLATQVISRVRAVFGVELPLRDFFEAPTIAAMAAAVLQKQFNWANRQDLDELLAHVEALPIEEVRRRLTNN